MAQMNQSAFELSTSKKHRRVRTFAGVLLMGVSITLGGCELPERGDVTDNIADPGFNPGAQQGVTVIPNATIIMDREDLVAVAPAGVTVTPEVIRDIETQFKADPERYSNEKVQVVYLGPIDFNFSRNEGYRAGSVKVEGLATYAKLQRSLPGHRVMWANMESENLYMINYPTPTWADEEVPELEGFDPVTTADMRLPSTQDANFDWLRTEQFRKDARGDLVGEDTRHRVFEENEPVKGKFFKRLLSLGGGTGAMIGKRHFLTAAHVVAEHDPQSQEVFVLDVTIKAGRNGNTQIGKSAKTRHLWWMADWTAEVEGTERRGYDMAWGVMDRPLGELTGYFGLMSAPADYIRDNELNIRNAAYSSCTPKNKPVPPNCLYRHIFMDSNNCTIRHEAEPDSIGWGRAVAHGCDTNRGHSGSPLVVTEDGSLYVWAVHSGAVDGVNYATRLTRNRHRNLMTEMFDRFPRNE